MRKRVLISALLLIPTASAVHAQATNPLSDTELIPEAEAPVVPPTATPEIASDSEAPAATPANPAVTETISVNDSPAPAEESSPPKSQQPSSRFVEEIIVTAQKREENVQDVPIAIAAFSAERLEAQGVQSTNDLQTLTPGLTISGSAGFSLIYLRGIGTSAFIPSFDPSVATYVDGIYIPSQQGTLTDLGGVERVEVLKGPQGTLFGRNSTGGAINVVTKSPGQATEVSASVQVGNYSARKVKAYVSFPITDTLAISASGIYSTEDSYYNVVVDPLSLSAAPNYSLDPEVTKGGRIKVRWTPLDNLDVTVAAYRILQHGSLAFTDPNAKPGPLFRPIIHPVADYGFSGNVEPVSNSVTTAYSGIGILNTSFFDIKLLGAHQDQNAYGNVYDFDGSQSNIASFNGLSEPSKLTTAELQFLSNEEGFTPDWLKWIAGLYYLHQEAGFDPFFAEVGDIVGLLPNLGALGTRLTELGLDVSPGPVRLGAFGVLETNSYSAFLQGTAALTDWLSITAGARYQEEDRFLIKQETFAQALGGPRIPTFRFNQPKVKQDNVSPKATIELRPINDLMFYATWARGFKSGSYNIVTLYTIPEYVDPERVTTYEIGTKLSFIEGLTFNAAIFNNEIDNLQETKLSLLSGGAISAENAGSARTRGVEFDAVWVPFLNANPGFVVTGGATYLDAIYTDYQNASGFDETTGLPFGRGSPFEPQGRDFTGNQIARTPEWSGTLGLSQTVDIVGGPLEISVDAYYNGGFNFSPQNGDATEQDAYTLLNGRISYLYENLGLRLTAFGKNLTAEKYAAASLTVDFGTYQRLAPPRTYGLILGYDF